MKSEIFTSAQEDYSKIKAGIAFAKVAELYSEGGASSENGGDLGWLEEGCIHKELVRLPFLLLSGTLASLLKHSMVIT